MLDRVRIGDKFVANAQIESQLGAQLPLVMDIHVQFVFAEIAVAVREAGDGPLEQTGVSLQEGR